MSLWIRKRGDDGKMRVYVVEGLPGIVAWALVGIAALLWLVVAVADYLS